MAKILNNVDLDKISQTVENGKRTNQLFESQSSCKANGTLIKVRATSSKPNYRTRRENR